MARPVTTLVVFFLAFNLFAGVLAGMGVADALGMDTTVGEDEEVDKLDEQASDVQTGTGSGETLFGMYNVLASGLESIYGFVFPGLRMLERFGVPTELTQQFLAPLFSLMIAIAIAAYVRGYDL